MKNVIRVFVLAVALMFVGTGVMAAEYVMAYRASTIDEFGNEIGTFSESEPFSVTAFIENYRTTAWGEVKFTLKGKGVSLKDYWPDIQFTSESVWRVWYEFPGYLVPEGVYTATFKFREMVKGAKWQQLVCRFQIVPGMQGAVQSDDSTPKRIDGLQLKRMVQEIER